MAFNAEAFLNQTVETVTADTTTPHPEGEFEGQIVDLNFNSGTGKESGKTWVRLKVTIKCLDAQVAADMGVEEAKVYDDFFIDLTEEGGLDCGTNRNIKLGKYRTAAGMNEEGEEFNIGMLNGATVGYKVAHKLNDAGDARAILQSVYEPEEE